MRGHAVTGAGRLAVFGLCAMAGACGGRAPGVARNAGASTGGDPARGRDVILRYHCGVCHTIPGVRGARGLVGPPLLWFSRRTFIAGELPNTPENLVRWVRRPEAIASMTAMPTLGLTDQEARDAAAYLYTLR